ncbi:MAG: hypothetical protein LC105_03110 [Chitinophagales bacterium]|nr:hypothetical protein [Chitinophagales bacterium]MCZ2392829.1 hypothetical protein [Chitinophagales bacterium]
MKNTSYLLFVLLILIFTSCDKKEDLVEVTNYQAEIENIGLNVILPTYKSLSDASAALKSATITLKNNPTNENLVAAKEAWKEARTYWEQSEGFLFGPVDQEGIDPSIDSWPLNVGDLNAVLFGATPLNENTVNVLEETLKGFHTIEFLLWGENSDKSVDKFTTREFEYLIACSGVLANDTKKLYDLWAPSSGDFIAQLTKAGKGSTIYISEKSALEEIANALVGITDEVGNSKIDDPFSSHDVKLEESHFSNNSKSDFADNIRSVQNIYSGKFKDKGNGISLTTIVRAKNIALDDKIQLQTEAAIQAILNINGTFTNAVITQDISVTKAQQAVRTLQATLEEELLPLISNL